MKEQGYFVANGDKIIVDWDRFSNEVVGTTFLEDLGANRIAAEYILENPPKKQTVNDQNQIVWTDTANQVRNVQILFSHISRMRNNLFHGAKFNGTWFDPQRSNELLSKGLLVLESFKDRVGID